MQIASFQILKMHSGSSPHSHHPSSLRVRSLSFCVGASRCKPIINSHCITFVENKRRGNLPSLINNKELFILSRRITSLRTQSSSRLKIRKHCFTNDYQDFQPRKIASWIQQRCVGLALNTPSTETRNDEE